MEAFSYSDAGSVSVGSDTQESVESSTPHDATVHPQTAQGTLQTQKQLASSPGPFQHGKTGNGHGGMQL